MAQARAGASVVALKQIAQHEDTDGARVPLTQTARPGRDQINMDQGQARASAVALIETPTLKDADEGSSEVALKETAQPDHLEGSLVSLEQIAEHEDTDGSRVPLTQTTRPGRDPAVKETSVAMEKPVGDDELDKVSIFSFFMEKDFRYYFQHPYFRLLVAYLVTLCNFIVYAEDPVAHSDRECFIPVVGNCFSFVCMRYPGNGWAVLKVTLWLIAIFCGLVVGNLVVHKIIFNRLFKLKMFSDGQGSWMTMFFTTILFLFIFSWLYNGMLMIGGDSTLPYRISSLMGIKNSVFLKAAACGTWCGDLFTAWMVTDIMLQEKLYPYWAKYTRRWWNATFHRIILFWITIGVTSTVVIMVISTDWINWDTLNRDFLPTNELARGFLASFVLVMDLMILMQDWDFPHFINNFDIKLPGVNTAHITFRVPKCLQKKHWVVHISGKWFNFGIIFFVLILDMNMWKNQIFYSPYEYGQYIDPDSRIHTVRDVYSLENHNETYLNYEWRRNNTNPLTNESYIAGDMVMNSRFYDIPLKYKGLAFIPSLVAFTAIGVLVWYFGRWQPTMDDPHGGRLMRRRKHGWLQTSRRFFSGRSWSGRHHSAAGVNLMRGSVARGSVARGSVARGSVVRGSVVRVSVVRDDCDVTVHGGEEVNQRSGIMTKNLDHVDNGVTDTKNIDEVDSVSIHGNNNNIE